MELNNEFRVGIPVKDAWNVLTDVERIAPHLPGAQLQEVEGDEYRGIVKVKVGPITAQYKGAATFLERDEDGGKVVLRASGRDTRGQGNANATITATLTPDGDGTKVNVKTDLTVTGKVAQFGRGVMADVSSKLLGQFVDALEKDLQGSGSAAGEEGGAETAAPEEAGGGPKPANGGKGTTGAKGGGSSRATPAGPAASVATAGTPVQESSTNGASAGAPAGAAPGGPEAFSAPAATAPETASPAPSAPTAAPSPSTPSEPSPATGARRISGPEAEPVDLINAAGGSVAKRLLPLLGLGVLLVLVVWLRRRK